MSSQTWRIALFCILAFLLTGRARAQTPVFTATGSMHTARYYHTATLLNNGLVLIAGGCAPGANVYYSAELYDPSTGNFTATGSLHTARCQHTATLLQNGMVLIAGGTGETSVLSSAELYNPSTGTLTVTGNMTTTRAYDTATLLQNGMVLIAGGNSNGGTGYLSSAELYNPSTGTFTATGSMTTTREYYAATLLQDGMVLMAGGNSGTAVLSSAELYNPAAGTFTATWSMTAGRMFQTATPLQDGTILMAGGDNTGGSVSSAELYNPATGTFTVTGSMTTSRYHHTATLLQNGMVLIAGAVGPRGTLLSSAELFDAETGTFAATSSMTTVREYDTSTLVPNGTVLMAGGESGSSGPALSSAELYEQSPSVTSSNNATFDVGAPGSFTLTANGYPTPSFSESGALPSGVTFAPATGLLGGTPTAGTAGNYSITFTASNGVGSNATQSFTLVVDQAAAITSANGATFALGTSPMFTVTVAGFPAPTLSEAGTLPSGVTFNPATGVLSGTPATGTAGNYPITFTASNGVGSNAAQWFTLTVVAPPTISVSASPAPNSSGWNNLNVTVTFTCTAGTLSIGSCPGQQTISTQGAGQIVSGTVTDTAGDTATASVTINLDKTIPVLTVNSPADQTVESSSAVTVSGTLTDALSGVSVVTCDGVTATLSGGAFSYNISLTVGVNLVVVRGTDIAGNVAGDNFHLSLTGALPAPASLAVSPTGVNMVVGGTQQFTVVDDQGRPRPDAAWSVDNTSIATIDTNSSPTLTAVAIGQANLTASVGSFSAQTQINVLSGAGTALPPGTVLWSAPTPTGYNVAQTLQAEPVLGSPALYSVQTSGGPQVSLSGLTSDGQQLWNSAPLSGSFTGIPDGNGGVLMLLFPGYPGTSSIVDLDGQTGAPIWQYTSAGTISLAYLRSGLSQYSHVAVGPDGSVYFEENVANVLSLVALDGTTGAVKARYSVPFGTDTITSDGSCGQTSAPEMFVDHGVQLTDPVVGSNGTVMAGQSVLSTVTTYGCTNKVSDDQQLTLLKMASDGTTSTTLVYDDASHHTQNPGSLIDEVIPDPFGGALVTGEYDYPPAGGQQSFHITDVASSGLSDFKVPFAATGLVLGDNNAVFMAGGNQAFAYQLPGGSQLWAYTAPSSQDNLGSVVTISGGGLVIADESAGSTTLVTLDATGTNTGALSNVGQSGYSWGGDLFGISSSGAFSSFTGQSQLFAAENFIMPSGNPSSNYLAIDQPAFAPLPSCPGAANPCAKEALLAAWNSIKALTSGTCAACDTYVFNILGGSRADFYKYLNLDSPNPRFYDGTRSYAHMDTTMCGNLFQQLFSNCPFGSQTVKDFMAANQSEAISRTPSETGRGPLVFFDPSQISLSLNSTSNQALIFHGALHGRDGLYDNSLEIDFNICTNQGSIQISNYLEKHVLGGTVLVCGN